MNNEYPVDSEYELDFFSYSEELNIPTLYNYTSQPQSQDALLNYPPFNPTPQSEASQGNFLNTPYNYPSQPHPPFNPTPQSEASQGNFLNTSYNYPSQPQSQDALLNYPSFNPTPQPEARKRSSVNNKWEQNFSVKILMMYWRKQEGRDWDWIEEEFAKIGITKGSRGSWYSYADRFKKELDALKAAAEADIQNKSQRLGASIMDPIMRQADYDNCWGRIATSMATHGSELIWTPERVKYAWTHGASAFFPEMILGIVTENDM